MREENISCSMSRRAKSRDNAIRESLFATLKKERAHREEYATRSAARASVFDYIELFKPGASTFGAGLCESGAIRGGGVTLPSNLTHKGHPSRKELWNSYSVLTNGKVAPAEVLNLPYEQAIELGDFADDGGVRKLDIGTAPTAAPVRLGDDADWEKEFAVYGFFGAKHDEVLLTDLEELLANLPDIGLKIEAIYNRRRHAEAVAAIPLPSQNPPIKFEAPPVPAPQEDDLDIEDMVEDVTDDED